MRTWLKAVIALLLLAIIIKLLLVGFFHLNHKHNKTKNYQGQVGVSTGLPIPRYVSLKAKTTNVRVGPGVQYRIAWTFTQRSLPVKIINEYDNWRYIEDYTGSKGWITAGLLSSSKYILVAPNKKNRHYKLYNKKDVKSNIIAQISSGAIGSLKICEDNWCKVVFDRVTGWIEKKYLWGVNDY
ncbi:SH3 domain-containing protein [Bartonella sp. DGB1]|uniref:SH3 domain-containing protein n=1 Tax=Bartonella sp. DGB1 TaxID=3239807 RepID=UPI003523A7AD